MKFDITQDPKREKRDGGQSNRLFHTDGARLSLTRITTATDTVGLADHLRSPKRSRVAVVVTCPGGTDDPLFDVESIAIETGDLADVFVIPPGRLSTHFSNQLPPETSVYGGAARVYPRGTGWMTSPREAPLVFMYPDDDISRKSNLLVAKALEHHHRPGQDDSARAGRPALTLVPKPEDKMVQEPEAPLWPDHIVQELRQDLATVRQATLIAVQAAEAESDSLRRRLASQTEDYRAKLAAARGKRQVVDAETGEWSPVLFATGEEAVRHAVYLAWTKRVPASEKTRRKLPAYEVGPNFAATIEALDSGQQAKAFKCVVDVLTDMVRDMPARRVHPLRSSSGGEDHPWIRDDGSVCFRANIETNAASARRLHWWRGQDGSIELSRVVIHDDMNP